MADVKFDLFGQPVPGRYIDLIQRYSVLYALYGPAADLHDVRVCTQRLVARWRARVSSLREEGWLSDLPGSPETNFSYIRNCIPSFVIADKKTKPCRKVLVCPFCYARWVSTVWDKLYPHLTTCPEAQSEFKYHIVSREHTFYLPVLNKELGTNATIIDNLISILTSVTAARRKVVELVDPHGAFVYTSIEPANNAAYWRIHHRQLFKLHESQPFPDYLKQNTNGKLYRRSELTGRDLLIRLSDICKYPKNLLNGDSLRTVQLLHARSQIRFRGHAVFGSFRQNRYAA